MVPPPWALPVEGFIEREHKGPPIRAIRGLTLDMLEGTCKGALTARADNNTPHKRTY